MSVSSANAPAGGKTRYVETLTSGTSWTVPVGVEYVNATLIGGGGSGGKPENADNRIATNGYGGQIITSNVTTTPGASIAYTIGAGGAGQSSNDTSGNVGGNTTFTGATTALGGNNGEARGSNTAMAGLTANNFSYGAGFASNSGAGGAGQIILEYWK